MGGTVAIASGKQLRAIASNSSESNYTYDDRNHAELTPQNIASRFKGCILVCPAISVKLPSDLIVYILENLIIPFYPEVFPSSL